MAGCTAYQEQIELDLDGELTAEQRRELQSHLAVCPVCRKYQEAAAALWQALESGMLMDPPADIAGPVMVRVRKARNWQWAGMISIALLAALSLGFLSFQAAAWISSLNLEWLPNLLGSFWKTAKVLFKGWLTLTHALPDEYWLGLSGLAAINLAMLLKVLGKPVRGGRTG